MTPEAAELAIQTAFDLVWLAQTPVAYDNKTFDTEKQNDPWVRLSIQHLVGTIATLGGVGSRCFRNSGIVFVQVFTPVGGGKIANTILAKTARNTFRGVQLSGGLWFRNASISHVGPDGKWYQQNVTAEFIFDENE